MGGVTIPLEQILLVVSGTVAAVTAMINFGVYLGRILNRLERVEGTVADHARRFDELDQYEPTRARLPRN